MSTPSGPVNNIEEARAAVARLVERFRANEAAYKNLAYNETQTRREFIDPFFKALGWDMDNEAGYAEAYKDVIHEDAIKVGGMTKAPDYCFRIGGQRKFFVEAKKPAVDMKNDPEPYYQLRRYAYSAKLPLSIVTDFEEFAVVDCRAKPSPGDKASTGRIRYWRYDEYLDHLEELLDTFSPEGIKKGGLDRLVTSAKAKRGTGEVDKEFLKEIETWRDLLARNIALRNPGLSQRELNTAVQLTIDRIIFLRICEDRGIEEYGVLQGMQNGANVYLRLCELFQRADQRYNSGLFHFREERGNPSHPDELTPGLAIDDKPLKQILKGLYYPDSPYEFSVLPADILGQVYEQFLGKVIRLTAGHQAKVEDKPEVKKAGGVYYTPTYIVDYIVKNTVGKLLEKSTPAKAAKLRILDPACGSGSFLIGAYEYLMDWHRDWYAANEPEKWAKGKEPRLFNGKNGWQLTTAEKKRILLNNIYGVDIDPQAVEVTKLSLLLKVLEEENAETIGINLKLFHERALPDLGNNIKCGNSLIGTDFYEGEQLGLLDDEERYRINAFDWDVEFPEIFSGKNPGFDAVIGNPPYVRVHRLSAEDKKYFWSHYKTFVAKSDIYACFIERSMSLLNSGGYLSFITPNTWTSLESFTSLREFVLSCSNIITMVKTPAKVFQNATVRTFLFILRNEEQSRIANNSTTIIYKIDESGSKKHVGSIARQDMKRAHLSNLLLHSESAAVNLYAKCSRKKVTVGSDFDFFYGFKTGDDERFLASSRLNNFYKPYVRSADVHRYGSLIPTGFIDYRPEVMKEHRKTARPGERKRFIRPKVIVARMGHELIATFDIQGMFVKDAMLLLSSNDNVNSLKVLVGILNSHLLQYLYKNYFATIDILKNALLALPLPNNISELNKARYDQMVELVNGMLELNKQLQTAKTSHDKNLIQRQIDATDRQIDRLVYELYDLTDEEIKIVEGASG